PMSVEAEAGCRMRPAWACPASPRSTAQAASRSVRRFMVAPPSRAMPRATGVSGLRYNEALVPGNRQSEKRAAALSRFSSFSPRGPGGGGGPPPQGGGAEPGAHPAAVFLRAVYAGLRRRAASRAGRLPPGQTLQPTALVHEAYLRLVGDQAPGWNGRRHF